MGRCELTALAPLFAVFAVFTTNLLLHPQGSVRADVGKISSEPLAKSPDHPSTTPSAEPLSKSPAQPLSKSPAQPLSKSPAQPLTRSPAQPSTRSPKDPHSPTVLEAKLPLRGTANHRGPGPEEGPKRPPQPAAQPYSPPDAAANPDVFRNGPAMCSTDVLIDNFLKCLTCEKKKDVREGFAECTRQSPDPEGIEVVLDQCEGHIFTASESPPERLLILCIDDHERTNLTTCLTGNMNRISAEPRHKLKPVTLFMRCAMSVRMEYCDK